MSLNLGWPNDNAPKNTTKNTTTRRTQDHLRIRDLARNIEAADRPRSNRQAIVQTGALRQSYEISLQNIDDNIYAMAAATAALDRVEGTLVQARSQIEHLCSRGNPVDLHKVERTLMALADHINQSVHRADENYINLLRDARLQMLISESGDREQRAMKVDLTLISLDKLIAWKLREGPDDPEAWIDLIDAMSRVVMQNVQILSSLILTLFAARDYTTGVVQLVTNTPSAEGNRAGSASHIATDFVQSARTALLRDESQSRPAPQEPHYNQPRRETRFDSASEQRPEDRRRPPNRLMTFLNQVTYQS